MPGKVVRAHAKWEAECANCHDRSNVRTQSALCLDCHKEIAADMRTRHGYHGRMPNAGAGECRACHTEHKGATPTSCSSIARSSIISRPNFRSRARTARSTATPATSRGRPGARRLTDCVGCHRGDDIHHGQFKQSCGECHSRSAGAAATSITIKTDFRLTGAHTSVACNACHIGGRYSAHAEDLQRLSRHRR